MVRLSQLLDKIDSFCSWWERLVPSSWSKAGVSVVTAYLFSYWALLTEQPPVVIATCALGAIAFVVCLFTQLPLLLRKYLSPPIIITVHQARSSLRGMTLPIFCVNSSPDRRVFVELYLCIPLSNGKEHRVTNPILLEEKFKQGLLPGEGTEGHLYYMLPRYQSPRPRDDDIFLFNKAYLHVTDHVSGRSVKVTIPGRFPPR